LHLGSIKGRRGTSRKLACQQITNGLLQNYQQPLDITICEDQRAFFKVSGTHAIYLTGNYVVPADDGHNHQHEIYDGEDDSEDYDDYDLAPDEDELDEEESDDIDELEDPRITELASDEEAPRLIKKEEAAHKGKNKRVAEDLDEEPANLDDIMAKSLKPAEPAMNGEPKLSKKQLKKLKNNAGKAVEAAVEGKDVKKEGKKDTKEIASPKADKKVQFAKNLEQGPANGAKDKKADAKVDSNRETKKDSEKPKANLGVKTVQGVKIDDKKLGKGTASKKGNKVGMRYIGKLEDGQVFDGTLIPQVRPSCSNVLNVFQPTKRGNPSPSNSDPVKSSKAGILVSRACPSAASAELPCPPVWHMAANRSLVFPRIPLSSLI